MVLAARFRVQWGAKVPRKFYGEDHWAQPLAWNRKAAKLGVRLKVFCASMADVFEELPADHPDRERMTAERKRLFALIDATPNLDWLLLTKRPENIRRMWADQVSESENYFFDKADQDSRGLSHAGPHKSTLTRRNAERRNVWLGCTVEDQTNADKRIPELLKCRDLSPVLFLSCEPLLSELNITPFLGGRSYRCPCGFHATEKELLYLGGDNWKCCDCGRRCEIGGTLDWIIGGAESGPHARITDPAWATWLADQCRWAETPFLWKQNGEWAPFKDLPEETIASVDLDNVRCEVVGEHSMHRVGKKLAGRLMDGVEHNGMPSLVSNPS